MIEDFREAIDSLEADPELGMIDHGLLLIGSINPDGSVGYAWRVVGDPYASQSIGVMELVKHELLIANDGNNP